MTKLRITVLFTCLIIGSCTFAQKVCVEGINYILDPARKTASVVDSVVEQEDFDPFDEPVGAYEGAIEIPKSVKYDGVKYRVTSIGEHAFYNCSITNVIIPNSIDSIKTSAFSHCQKLTEIVIPKSVTSIGPFAFAYCTGITSLIIPKTVTNISDCAFNRTGITSLVVDKNNPNYCTVDNVLFNKEQSQLLYCPASVQGVYNIPNTVTTIRDNAFDDCKELTSITIPLSVTSIGSYAFLYCSGLTSIRIPESVKTIGEYAFLGCTALTSVSIPASVTSIARGTFNDCSRLATVTIPESVGSIGTAAFSQCSALTTITIPQSVIYIEDAFGECPSLTKVTIESNAVLSLGFEKDAGLSSIFGEQVVEYVIGNSVKKIGKLAFNDCTKLERVTIGNSVTIIEEGAFAGCKSLTDINIPNTVVSIGDYAFDGCKSLSNIEVSNMAQIGKMAFPYHISKNAQPEIKRTFFGLTLGVSTKQDAITTLLAKGVDLIANTRQTLSLRKPILDGFDFRCTTLHFLNGIFYQIDFREKDLGEDGNMSNSKYNKVNTYYTKRHDSYKLHCLEPETCYFDDDMTSILLLKDCVIFVDNNMKKQRSKAQEERNREIHPLNGTRIDRTVLGCTLGISNKQQVIDALKQYDINVVNDCYPDSVVFSSVTHEAIRFDALTAKFFAGKLQALWFTNYGKGLTRNEFNVLERKMEAKYAVCSNRNGHDQKGTYNEVSFDDDVTSIGISLKGQLGIMPGGLFYQDNDLTNKSIELDMRSLRGMKQISPDKQYLVDFFKKLQGSGQ